MAGCQARVGRENGQAKMENGPLGQQGIHRDAFAVFGDVEGAAFRHVAGIGWNAEGFEDGSVNVFEPDGVFDGEHGVLVGSFAVNKALLKTAAKEQEVVAAAEMAVEPVHFLTLEDELFTGVPFGEPV